MALYRGMDRKALDAAYNNSAAVGGSADIIADWQRRSAALRARVAGLRDVAYAASPGARLDFFPCGRGAAPTLLFFHGGYWQHNAKDGFAFVAEGALARGINVAIAGYTLAPAARMDAIAAEARAAASWLGGHLGGWGADPERLFAAGWSAGGHLTALVMGEPAIRGGIAISGIYDLEPIRLSYLNDKLGLDPGEVRRNSPALHLPARAGRLIVAVGGAELPELRRQSRDYAEAWRRQGLPGAFQELPGCHHYAALEQLARPDAALARALAELVG
ncbi:MAG: alpha/beta hydrolase [Stellaceae bacterium]